MERRKAKGVRRFSLDDAPVVAENERILGGTAPTAATATTAPVKAPQAANVGQSHIERLAPEPIVANTIQNGHNKPNGTKSKMGVTVYVPIDYYERIMIMKMRSGIPIKDIALQAIMEYIDNHATD